MSSWHAPQSVYTLGHAALTHLLQGPVVVQEKIDGSFIQFGVLDGALRVRSRNQDVYPESPGMFGLAYEIIRSREDNLIEGWTYRGEYLSKPKHNALAYDRAPSDHIILFDVLHGEEKYWSPKFVAKEARFLSLEAVPTHFEGLGSDVTQDRIEAWANQNSILGGPSEGVVVKNYGEFGRDKKALFGKYVRPAFKEVHRRETKTPSGKDIVQELVHDLRTPARWDKAVYRLRDQGLLAGEAKDIGRLCKEIPQDILKEEKDYILDRLMAWAWPRIARGVLAGFADYYKARLFDGQFVDIESKEKESA